MALGYDKSWTESHVFHHIPFAVARAADGVLPANKFLWDKRDEFPPPPFVCPTSHSELFGFLFNTWYRPIFATCPRMNHGMVHCPRSSVHSLLFDPRFLL